MRKVCGNCKHNKRDFSKTQNDGYSEFCCGNEDSENYVVPTFYDDVCDDFEEKDDKMWKGSAMERLTQTSDKGEVVFTFDLDVTFQSSEMKKILKIAEKLKEYEDLEEQGLLLRLPCNIGDTIYEVSYENREFVIKEHIVKEFIYRTYRFPRIEIYCENENGFLVCNNIGKLDECLFLTQAEAEQKLKEMDGD